MTTTKEIKKNIPVNVFGWVLFFALIAGGIYLNYTYANVDASLRLIAWIVLVVVALGLTLITSQGKRALQFVKSAQAELRKVVWPTRQETIQTALIVLALVVLLALIIWGLDTFLLWAVGLLTGQRG